jgi:hypothetical protein
VKLKIKIISVVIIIILAVVIQFLAPESDNDFIPQNSQIKDQSYYIPHGFLTSWKIYDGDNPTNIANTICSAPNLSVLPSPANPNTTYSYGWPLREIYVLGTCPPGDTFLPLRSIADILCTLAISISIFYVSLISIRKYKHRTK